MSVAAIILGLLCWFSLPPLYRKGFSQHGYVVLRVICRFLGIALIVGGIIYGFFR